MDDRVQVISEPGFSFGAPTVAGVRVDAIGDRVFFGDSIDEVTADYDGFLHRGHVLVACWWLGLLGRKPWPQRWRQWAHDVYPLLAANEPDYRAVPDPPSRES